MGLGNILGGAVAGMGGLGTALAGAGLAADIWSGRQAAEDQRTFNREEAQATRAWQTEMSNTQYQRAMSDMKAAGLNPMLAYMQGGAGTPSGATASSGIANTGSVSQNVASAVALSKVRSEIDLMNAQATKAKAEADLVGKTMPPADPWRMFYEFLRTTGLFSSGKSVVKDVKDYFGDMVKTYPLLPQGKTERRPLQPMSEQQRDMLQRKGYYYRYPKLEGR